MFPLNLSNTISNFYNSELSSRFGETLTFRRLWCVKLPPSLHLIYKRAKERNITVTFNLLQTMHHNPFITAIGCMKMGDFKKWIMKESVVCVYTYCGKAPELVCTQCLAGSCQTCNGKRRKLDERLLAFKNVIKCAKSLTVWCELRKRSFKIKCTFT